MKILNRLILFILTLSSFNSIAQTIKVDALPAGAEIIENSNRNSRAVKINAKDSRTAVLGVLSGYATQGIMASELKTKGVSDYTIKLNKYSKPPKGFASKKIEFAKLTSPSGGDANTEINTFISNTIAAAGYTMVGSNKIFSGKSDIADFAVGGEMTWVNSGTAGRGFQVSVLIHWSVFSVAKENIVYEITTGGFSDSRQKSAISEELKLAIADAVNGLVYDPKFQEIVGKKSETVSTSAQDAISINKPTLKKFESYSAVVKESIGSVVTIKTNFGIGSGFIISDNGYVITNHHVINSAEKVEVVFENGFSFEAKIIRSNEDKDVALIKISGSGFKPLLLNTSDGLNSTGTEVIAIGTPENIKLGQTVTKGIISGKREIDEKIYLQTDVAINSGNSGGPLINTSTGEVIGIVAAKIKAKGVEGLGFAIPIAESIKYLNLKFE
ncbi:MAG: trypsin-like peptidase domain-containing protein [Agriterribacter sp.]